MRTKKLMAFIGAMVFALAAQGQTRQWGIEASMGGGEMQMDDEVYWDLNNDEVEVYRLTADYYLGRHFALSGGLYLERQGLMTEFADGLGLMTHYLFGIQAGAKWYPLHPKYIVQPYVGASLYTNFCNLPHQSGSKRVKAEQGDFGEGTMHYDLQSAVASVGPKIGVEIRVFSSLSLCLSYDYRWALYGHSDADLALNGQTYHIRDTDHRGGFNLGLKLDLPLRRVDQAGQKLATFAGFLLGLLGG